MTPSDTSQKRHLGPLPARIHFLIVQPLPLQVWLKQPLVDVADISTRHDIVEALAADTDLRNRLRDQNLRGAPSTFPLPQPLINSTCRRVSSTFAGQILFSCLAVMLAAKLRGRALPCKLSGTSFNSSTNTYPIQ